MAETLIKDRIKFKKKGSQRDFILKAKGNMQLTWKEFAKKVGISAHTLADWKREKHSISYVSAELIRELANLPYSRDHSIIDWREHMRKAAKSGGRQVMRLYGKVGGDTAYRKSKWKEWWEKTGKYKNKPPGFQSLIEIKRPQKTKFLAEFVGIMLGDGGVYKYFISVTLSSAETNYTLFVKKIIKKLFNVDAKIQKLKYAKAVNIVVNRKSLVDFCQHIGLVQGDKIRQQIDIPIWIKDNKEFKHSCVRGLMDTDGCFYVNSYNSNSKLYKYFKIAFVSASVPLLKSVQGILNNSGIHSVICYRKSQKGGDVRIVSNYDVLRYIKLIGSNNEKHLKKIREWQSLHAG